MTDTELIDVLESLPVTHGGGGWKVRKSSTGRGWRLMTTTEAPNYPTVREAIEAFARDQGERS